jgi:DegV family protein with EDD domain
MTVKIVTDSGSDLPANIARALGITIVPVYIYFGNKVYRDGVDISPDELYKRLSEGGADYPTTTQPIPIDLANVYRELSKEAEGIVSIHLPARLSGTYNSALQGKVLVKTNCEIEVIDSLSVSMGLGLIVMAAARVAQAGGNLLQVIREAKKAIAKVHILGVMDTLKYLLAGGRISKTKATIGSLLSAKPLLAMRDGEIFQTGMVRTYAKGLDRQYEFVEKARDVQQVAIVHSTNPKEANTLKERISSIIPEERIFLARLGAGLGVHGGPGTMITAIRCD